MYFSGQSPKLLNKSRKHVSYNSRVLSRVPRCWRTQLKKSFKIGQRSTDVNGFFGSGKTAMYCKYLISLTAALIEYLLGPRA